MASPAPARVFITHLKLGNFRNYQALNIDLNASHVVMTGDNGAGKTNLLEAISLLTPGRGMRRAAYCDVARSNCGQFSVHARIDGAQGEAGIGTGTMQLPNGELESGRRIRINGSPAKSSDELLEWLRVMWLVPAMDGLFTGPAGDRRRFLDRLVLAIEPGHAKRTLDFEKSMRARNRLLNEDNRNDAWFEAIENQMAQSGIAIALARHELVALLRAMNEQLPDNSPFPKADIELVDGFSQAIDRTTPAIDMETQYCAQLAQMRMRDRGAGRTLEGPHKGDLHIFHRPKNMRAALCSTGEQKALLVGMILSHARLTSEMAGMAPILLLDEIAAHLDAGRRAALFSILDELNCQAFMTGTDAQLFSSLTDRAQFLDVKNGTIIRAS